jgi:hypothetical protein
MDPEEAKLGLIALILFLSYGALLFQKAHRSEGWRKQ